jgi:aryl-alcohol dehydrogenase-like predicted oxidoreductase
MKYRVLGKTGLTASVVGIGTWQLGGEWGKSFEQAEVDAMFNKARDLGINLVDTAECYGNHLAEEMIGNTLTSDRKEWIVATKFGHEFIRSFERRPAFSAQSVTQQLEASLRALRTDYVDIYQIHSADDTSFNSPELWETLDQHLKAGKIRHLGISLSSKATDLYQVSAASALGVETIQTVYNRLEPAPEKNGLFVLCQKANLGVLARVPLASGLLSGRYSPGVKFPDNDVREKWYSDGRDEKIRAVVEIQRNEVPKHVPMTQWALAWCLRHRAVTAVIPGCKTVRQVEENGLAAELVL